MNESRQKNQIPIGNFVSSKYQKIAQFSKNFHLQKEAKSFGLCSG